MRILFINKFFHLNGGSERVFFQERDFMKAEGHHVVDFSMHDERNFASDYQRFFVSNVDYDAHGGFFDKMGRAVSFIHSSEAVRMLSALLDVESPHLAHLHNIYHQLTPAIIPLLKSRGVKVVLTLHDGKLVCPSYLMLNKGRICEACRGRRFHRSIFSRCQGSMSRGALLTAEAYWHRWRGSYDHVDRFVAPSDFLGDLVTRRRVPREKMTVLRNGIDLEEYRPHYTDQGYALYFGRLSQEKGIQTLLAAHETMARPIPLKVVGTGPVQDDLRSRFTTAEFLGYKEGNELRELVGKAAFVVVPSEWYENCSMVVLEAMALGKPVIGSRIGGIPEQIDDGKTGFLFQMGDQAELARKMDTLLAEPELRARMGRAARRKIQNEFSLDAHCTRLLSIYHELLHS